MKTNRQGQQGQQQQGQGTKKPTGGDTKRRPYTRCHRTNEQRELDKAKIPSMLRRGLTPQMIAEELGISYAMVKRDWKVVLTELREQRDEDTEALVQAKLQEYAEVKREAWEAWERSKLGTIEEEEKESSSNRGGTRRSHIRKKITSAGDSTFLTIIQNCVKEERELLSLNPTKKLEVKGNMMWDVFSQAIPEGEVPDEIENSIRVALEASGVIKAPHGQLPNQNSPTIILDAKEDIKNGNPQAPGDNDSFNPQSLDEFEAQLGDTDNEES